VEVAASWRRTALGTAIFFFERSRMESALQLRFVSVRIISPKPKKAT
jgi:hypothetical protein